MLPKCHVELFYSKCMPSIGGVIEPILPRFDNVMLRANNPGKLHGTALHRAEKRRMEISGLYHSLTIEPPARQLATHVMTTGMITPTTEIIAVISLVYMGDREIIPTMA